MAKSNDSNHPTYYIVALLDMLGQRSLLDKYDGFSGNKGRAFLKTEDGLNSFNEIMGKTYGVVCEVRKNFEYALDTFKKAILQHPDHEKLLQEEQKKVKEMAETICSFDFFSDTITIYTELTPSDDIKIRFRIASILYACMAIMLTKFSESKFFRGGIEVGIGIEFPEKGIYGWVLNEAYNLENKVAMYPRIVIGDELKNIILRGERCNSDSNFFSGMNERLDSFCKSSIVQDKDGRCIVNFLGKTFANMYPNKKHYKQSQDYIIEGLKSVEQKYTYFMEGQNSKLAFRYSLLRNYYLENLDNWRIQCPV